MTITMGLFDHMVLQRNRQGVSAAEFSGDCAAAGPVMATAWRGGKKVKGLAGVVVGMVKAGRLHGCLAGLPAGGPYEIELKVGGETRVVRDVLVGDVWLLGGQSNMQGCGLFPKERLPVDPYVRAFYMDDRWDVARDPVHNMWACVDPVHDDLKGGTRTPKPPRGWGVCPGPAFGNEMRRLTGVPQGIIACAHGGTTMVTWDPARKSEGGKSLYGAMVRRLVKNGRGVAGLVWYQGCSDANQEAAGLYTQRMQALVRALRRDSGQKSLPVVVVQIARTVNRIGESAAYWNSIQDQQRRLPETIGSLATVPAVDLALDDNIHLSGASHAILGVRLAQAMHVLREGRKAGRLPIALKDVRVESVRALGVAVITFGNVVGRLRAGSRPDGFFIVDREGGSANHFDIQLDGARVLVRSLLTADDLKECALSYGYGINPYCNITDEAGRSLPVFGPYSLGVPRAITPFVRELRVSGFQPSAGRLDSLKCPRNLVALGLQKRAFPGNFCDIHLDIGRRAGRDEVVYYACAFTCAEAMRLALVLGYDGPVKAWVDGKPLVHDPAGTNPATVDKGTARGRTQFTAAAGGHEMVVALGTNHGAAWGIFLRLRRMDVPRQLLAQGPAHYAMPVMMG